MGDFNEEPTQLDMKEFMTSSFSLNSLIHKPTCYKSTEGRCICRPNLDEQIQKLSKSGSFEMGISDHHHLIYSMFKSNFKKVSPQVIEYVTVHGKRIHLV